MFIAIIVFCLILAYLLALALFPNSVAAVHGSLPGRLRADIDVRTTRIVGVIGSLVLILIIALFVTF